MKRHRYFVVAYPKDTQASVCVENGRFKNHLPLHELLHEYHYTRLDDDYVLVTGEYSPHNHEMLIQHEKSLMLPSIGSNKCLLTHGEDKGRKSHVNALLNRYKMRPNDSIADLLDKLEQHEGPLFTPAR